MKRRGFLASMLGSLAVARVANEPDEPTVWLVEGGRKRPALRPQDVYVADDRHFEAHYSYFNSKTGKKTPLRAGPSWEWGL